MRCSSILFDWHTMYMFLKMLNLFLQLLPNIINIISFGSLKPKFKSQINNFLDNITRIKVYSTSRKSKVTIIH